MAIYELKSQQITEVPKTTFGKEGVKERSDLQRLLRTHIDVVAPNTLVLAEEFGHWQDSKRRIDLLGLDKEANLVVIELKRSEDGGHMELQALRYAAMVSTMTFEQAVGTLAEFQTRHEIEGDATQAILKFLDWSEPDEDQFAQEVRLVLVAADFSKELTTAVIWLNTHDLDIRCVRLKPYSLQGKVLLDVQQVLPLPEATDYQIQLKEKVQKERKARKANMDFTRYDVTIDGEIHENQNKRRAILAIVTALIHRGVSAERINDTLAVKPGTKWMRVAGQLDSQRFVEAASEAAQADGRSFDPRRWFVKADELIYADGHTSAFTNQWGDHWSKAMAALTEAFSEHKILFTPTKADEGS